MDKPSNTQDELAWEREKWEQEHNVPSKPSPKAEAPKKEPPPPPSVPTIKTFQNDIASSIRNQDQSLVRIALAKKEREHSEEGISIGREEPHLRKDILIIGGTVVTLLGISGFLFWTTPGRVLIGLEERVVVPSFGTSTTTPKELLVSSPIPSKNRSVVDVSGAADALSLVREELSKDTPAGTLREVVVVSGESRVGAQAFFSLWAKNMPASLARVLGGEFSLGAYGLSGDTPYLVFAVSRNEAAIAGMLAWEARLSDDFSSLSGIDTPAIGKFTDKRVEGMSVRMQSNGLLYTFPINGKIVLTQDEATLKKVREVFGF